MTNDEKTSIIAILQSGLQKEIEAQENAEKLMKIFENNGINLELSTNIYEDEIKHQMIVRNMIDKINEL